MPGCSVSVVIPAYNCEDTIGETLGSLAAQDYDGSWEVIVVDDGSRDGSAEKIRGFAGVKLISQVNAGPAAARNAGAAASSGTIIVFTDSDCRPRPDWLRRLVGGFTDLSVWAVSGSYGIANAQDWLARVIHTEIRFRHLRLMPDFPRVFGSYNVAIRRDVFVRLGGFNTAYRRASGEDNDLSYKIASAGGRIRFVPEALVDHYHQDCLGAYLHEQYRHGIWRVRMYLDHPAMMGGDGYTFWKDIIEIPAVYACASGLLAGAVSFFWPAGSLGFAVAGFCGGFLLALQVWFVLRMMAATDETVPRQAFWPDSLLAAWVFCLRSLVRAWGFLLGARFFFRNKFMEQKKSRITLRH